MIELFCLLGIWMPTLSPQMTHPVEATIMQLNGTLDQAEEARTTGGASSSAMPMAENVPSAVPGTASAMPMAEEDIRKKGPEGEWRVDQLYENGPFNRATRGSDDGSLSEMSSAQVKATFEVSSSSEAESVDIHVNGEAPAPPHIQFIEHSEAYQ